MSKNKEEKKEYYVRFVSENGHITACEASNKGFTAAELIGLLEIKQQDIIRQVHGEVAPEIIYKRTVVKDDQGTEEEQ